MLTKTGDSTLVEVQNMHAMMTKMVDEAKKSFTINSTGMAGWLKVGQTLSKRLVEANVERKTETRLDDGCMFCHSIIKSESEGLNFEGVVIFAVCVCKQPFTLN